MQFRLTVIWHGRCHAIVLVALLKETLSSSVKFPEIRILPCGSAGLLSWLPCYSEQVKAQRCVKSYLTASIWCFKCDPEMTIKSLNGGEKSLSLYTWATVNSCNAPFPTRHNFNTMVIQQPRLCPYKSHVSLQSLLLLCEIADSFPNY